MNMKTSWLVVTVLAVHALAVGILVMQGCRMTSKAPAVKTPSETRPVSGAASPAAPTRPVEQPALVAPPPARVAEPAPAARTTTYVVKRGDTLSAIASRYNLRSAELMALNRLNDPNHLREGQTLLLPGDVDVKPQAPAAPKKSEAPAAAERPAARPVPGSGEYVVKSGDTLSTIARAHGVTVKAIRDANGLKSDIIRVGQKLAIPGKSRESVVPGGTQEQEARKATVSRAQPEPEAANQAQTAAGAATQSAEPVQTGDGYREVVVGPDEDLYTIAMRWAVSVAELKKANGLTDDAVKPGQRIKIPISE